MLSHAAQGLDIHAEMEGDPNSHNTRICLAEQREMSC